MVSIINLGAHVAMCLSRFLPSDSREQRSNAGLLGIAARSVLVSPIAYTLSQILFGTREFLILGESVA